MTTPNANGGLELAQWQIGDLRLTAFPNLLVPLEGQTTGKQWQELLGAKPESVLSHKFGTEVEENGPFGPGGRLTYQRSPRVIQWMLTGVPDPEKPGTSFLSPQILTPFGELMYRWLVDCPPLQRLAFGAALYLPVKDRPEAYAELEKRLHVGLKYSDDEGDFLYQYNRRRRSHSVPDVKINRLSKWTWVPLGEVRVKDGKLMPPPESACLLELDINTVPEFQGTLRQDRNAMLFDEMIRLGVEIAERGDVP
jgi:hypothetical protein